MAKPPPIVEIVAQASSPASSGSVPLPVGRVATSRGGTPLELAAGTAALHLVAVRKHLPDGLKVRPISDHGNVNEIIGKFGGADQLRNAVNQLQSLLYAA